MVQSLSSPDARLAERTHEELHLKAFEWMLTARLLDDRLASLYRAGLIPGGGVYLGRGQEALSVSVGISLRQGDVFAPLIRDGAGRLAFGETVLEAVRTCLGSPLGPMRARDGNVHRGKPREGYLPMISHLGAMIAVVNGTLIARRFKKQTAVVGAACIGEGATSTGACHEAINQAAVEKLPLVLIVANNQYAYSTPASRQFACASLVDRAVGYGVRGHAADGTDLTDCMSVVGKAVELARKGEGPQMVVAKLLRLCGHGEHDDAHYIDPLLRQTAAGRDCLKVAEEKLLQDGWLTVTQIEEMRMRASREIEEAVTTALADPQPDPYQQEWSALSTARLREGEAGAQ
jgi:pyruvate dehydrogenase E1 component alpha subunit/2-oxoisovalerate dehydrogenase E1 component alpha subunit